MILSQREAQDEFRRFMPANLTGKSRAAIVGPCAQLVRYREPSEREFGRLGSYTPALDNSYFWPTLEPYTAVDLASASLFVDNAWLQIYFDPIGGGDGSIAPVAGYQNRIRTSATNGFRRNGTSFPRLTALRDRDVRQGDVVILRGGTPVQTFVSTVADLVPDLVNAVVGSATSDAGNGLSQPNTQLTTAPSVNPTGGGASGGSLAAGTYYIQYTFVGPFGESWGSAAHTGATPVSFTISAGNIPRVTLPSLPAGVSSINIYLTQPGGSAGTETLYATGITTTTFNMSAAHTTGTAPVPGSAVQIAGTINNVRATANSSSYRGDAVGDISEVYTVTVIQGSTGGDATTARLSVVSASGRDDVASVTPAAFGSDTAIGTRGLTVRWTTASSHNFVVGQKWQIVARQSFTAPTASAGGSYTGPERNTSMTYVVRVSRGGRYSDTLKPQIIVARVDGGDSSGPTDVPNHTTAIPIGTRGVTVSFSNNGTNPGLRRNDVYYVQVTSASDGAYKTIVLQNNLPAALLSESDLELTLAIPTSIEVAPFRPSAPAQRQWLATENAMVVYSGMEAIHSSFTDGGVPVPVPVINGTLYASYRSWRASLSEQVQFYTPSSTDPEVIRKEIEATSLGKVDPDNPLAYAVWKAATNSNLQSVAFVGVAKPDRLQDWENAVALLAGVQGIYGIVPLSTREDVIQKFVQHVDQRSSDSVGGEWRVLWAVHEVPAFFPVVHRSLTENDSIILATLNDDPDVPGAQYTYLTSPSGNARFITRGVLPGDIVRYLFTNSLSGQETFQEFVVASVVNEDTLRLATGHTSAVTVAQRVEVWRRATTQAAVQRLTQRASFLSNPRVRLVWPDSIVDTENRSVSGVFLAAALSGLASGILPHQGMRQVEILGFSSTPRSNQFLGPSHWLTLAGKGVWVVATDSDGTVYTHSAVTTDYSSLDKYEESLVRTDDAIRQMIYSQLSPFFGRANNVPNVHQLIQHQILTVAEIVRNSSLAPKLGSIVDTFVVESIEPHPTIRDRLVVKVFWTRPYPLNQATIVVLV